MFIKYNIAFLLLILSLNLMSNISNDPSNWYVVTDQVKGGKSELEADYNDGIFSLSGFVTTENNGGFVRLAHRPKNVDQSVNGIRFMAKGNDETYEIHVTMQGMRMPPWAYHSSKFDVSDEWQMFEINFANFEKKSGRQPNNNSQQRFFSTDVGMDFASQTVLDIKWGRA